MRRNYLAVALILLASLFLLQDKLGLNFGKNKAGNENKKEQPQPNPNPQPPSKMSYKGKNVQVTKHAACRMECRFIKENEIMEVLAQDYINTAKTRNDGDCPSYAYEGKTNTGKRLRIVVADCEKIAKLVTVIDLNSDFKCVCD